MGGKDVSSDFIFFGNRVKEFKLETRNIENKKQRTTLSYDFDYNVNDVQRSEDKILGIIEFIVKARVKIKRRILFKVELVMEGALAANQKSFLRNNFWRCSR